MFWNFVANKQNTDTTHNIFLFTCEHIDFMLINCIFFHVKMRWLVVFGPETWTSLMKNNLHQTGSSFLQKIYSIRLRSGLSADHIIKVSFLKKNCSVGRSSWKMTSSPNQSSIDGTQTLADLEQLTFETIRVGFPSWRTFKIISTVSANSSPGGLYSFSISRV